MFDALLNPLAQNPKVLAAIGIFLVVHTVLKAAVDALIASRAEWDKTPLTDDTPFEKAVTYAGRALGVLGKAAAYLVGLRQANKPK